MAKQRIAEPNRELEELVSKVVKLAEDLGRGDTLLHTQIEKVTRVKRVQDRSLYDQITKKARQQIERERGIAFLPVRDVGYQMLSVNETNNDLVAHRNRKKISQTKMAMRSLRRLPDHELTDHQKNIRAIRLESESRMKNEISTSLRVLQIINQKTSGLPRLVERRHEHAEA